MIELTAYDNAQLFIRKDLILSIIEVSREITIERFGPCTEVITNIPRVFFDIADRTSTPKPTTMYLVKESPRQIYTLMRGTP